MPQLYKDTYKKIYVNRFCSAATLCTLIMIFLVITVPFFIGYYSNNFYKKVGEYFEMPKVTFTHEYAIESVETTNGVTSNLFYTTVPNYAHKNYNTLAPPYFSFYSDNENDDAKPEKYVFDIMIRGNPDTLIIALAFNYEIETIIEEKMVSLAFLKINNPNGISKVNAYGSLVFKQRTPTKNDFDEKILYNSNPLDKVLNGSMTKLYQNYLSRQEYTEFEGNIEVQPYGNSNQVQIHIEIAIPKLQEFQYIPGFLESLKSAWVQYIYILIPFYLLLVCYVLRFIFRNQIIETHISNNLPLKEEFRWFRKFKELLPATRQ
mmetsp:Transcript_29899/g.26447  ORF Transcript_29899/g.26447 Transcript_29899/m.26447 type:complete len:319 (+) Transcript_29899:24-980(+)